MKYEKDRSFTVASMGWSDVENEFDGIKREKLIEKLEFRQLEACVEKWYLFP